MPSNVRPGKSSGPNTRNPPPVAPMSERQQMALLMQMTSSPTGGVDGGSRSPSSSTSSSSSSSVSTANVGTKPPRDRNERGETPLHLAAIRGDLEQVCRLLAHRAEPNAADFAGWTPLHEACNYGWYEVALRLIQSGASVNAKGYNNDTPLHDAVGNEHLKLIKLLVEKGADIHMKNIKGISPYDMASATVQPYLLNANLPLPETTNTSSTSSTTRSPRSRDDKKVSSAPGDKKSSTDSSAMEGGSSKPPQEDVYEFKSSKDTDAATTEKDAEPADSEMDGTDPLSIPTTTASSTNQTSEEVAKRPHTDVEANEDSEKEEENKKKKRKEDTKESATKTTQRGQNKGQGNKQVSGTSGKHSTSGSASKTAASVEKKSPESSPKPASTASAAASSDAEDDSSNSGDGKSDLKVPPLKIVIPQSTVAEQESGNPRNGKNNSQRAHPALPYVVASSNSNDSTDKEMTANSPDNGAAKEGGGDKKEPQTGSETEESTAQQEPEPVPSTSSATATATAPPTPAPVEHPRKRKIKQNREQQQTVDNADSSAESREVHPHEQPITNCYKLFMNIRQQVDKRRKGLFLVQPKPPQGFKDYLMNRCTYVLANTAPTTPNINYPPTLPAQLKDLFAEQEKERYRLRMQHVIEKEKLVLSVEQEILRVHGRAARALANQSLPFSVCTILKEEELYNLITPEQEEKDRNARSRYNGRLFLSWLQDVDDKWEKIKEHMLLRHHHEAESLHAVQKMNWEWKLKELSLCDRKITPKIDELHVPEVHVSDDFDLLPA